MTTECIYWLIQGFGKVLAANPTHIHSLTDFKTIAVYQTAYLFSDSENTILTYQWNKQLNNGIFT